MTTSIIVPCHYKHFKMIPDLLGYYEKQSVLPDEVVIALTMDQTDMIAQEAVKNVLDTDWLFNVKIVYDDGEFPGIARNRACACSVGNLLICQDADDIPHPRRTEFIKSVFENYEADLLIHRWLQRSQDFDAYTDVDAPQRAQYFNGYDDITAWDFIHNGNIALTREVFEQVKWPSISFCEDVRFNQAVFEKFKYKVGLDLYLMIYQWELSSYKDRDFPR